MDQSAHSMPRLAMAPVPDDDSQDAMQSECDDINQAWFTTKEDKDSLQGKGICAFGDRHDGNDSDDDSDDGGLDVCVILVLMVVMMELILVINDDGGDDGTDTGD
jgi:hypothetical protein